MDFEKVIRQRKMVRQYIANKQIPEELIMVMRPTTSPRRCRNSSHWFASSIQHQNRRKLIITPDLFSNSFLDVHDQPN